MNVVPKILNTALHKITRLHLIETAVFSVDKNRP